jgi:hypothetical protein
MLVLGSLPNLAILILLENSFDGKDLSLSFQPESFPSLLVLLLQPLDVVRRVEFDHFATPKLELLRLGGSSQGDFRLSGLPSLSSLREVVLSNQGPYSEYMTGDMREQLALHPNRPVLRIGS